MQEHDLESLTALGRAVLQLIDALPVYPREGEPVEPVAGDLRFAVRLTDGLWDRLAGNEPGKETARHLLFDRIWQFEKPDRTDPATFGDDEVPF